MTDSAPDQLVGLASQMLLGREAVEHANEALEYLKRQQADVERELANLMVAQDVSKLTYVDRTIYTRVVTAVSPIEKVKLYQWLKANGYADLVVETVMTQTLKAWWKELPDIKQEELKAKQLVSVFEDVKLGVRKA